MRSGDSAPADVDAAPSRDTDVMTLPVDADGVPIRPCDVIDLCDGTPVAVVAVSDENEFVYALPDGTLDRESDADTCRHHRDSPRLLGADGIAVLERDVVWDLTTGLMGRVLGFDCLREGDVRLGVGLERMTVIEVPVFRLTHTEPDSWERLQTDARDLCETIAYEWGDLALDGDPDLDGMTLQDAILDLVARGRRLSEQREAE